jgi:phenylacetate-CoA ligase
MWRLSAVAALGYSTIEVASREVSELGARVDVVVVSLHWGVEYCHVPAPEQMQIARSLIDAGATLILGHHAHVIQGVERHGNGLIAYGLGNAITTDLKIGSRVAIKQSRRTNSALALRVVLARGFVKDFEAVPYRLKGDKACVRDRYATRVFLHANDELATNSLQKWRRRRILEDVVLRPLWKLDPRVIRSVNWGHAKKARAQRAAGGALVIGARHELGVTVYPTLFRHVLFPALDVLNGTSVARKYEKLLETQWLSRRALDELQERKLETALRDARESSNFYAGFWDTGPAHKRATSRYPALDGIPIISKADLRGHVGAFPLSSYTGRVFKVHTSGSTGEPMVYLRCTEQESWFWALRLRMWNWGGYVPGEPYLTLNLNPRTLLRKRLQDVLFRCSYHGFNANAADVDAVIADLCGRRVKHLIGYASSLFLLSRAMRERGIPNPGVRSILSTGDTLLPSYRTLIEEVFGVRVCDYYGAGGEGVHVASQCEVRGEYHLHVENVVVEILKDGRPAEPGEMGEIVVTQLDNHAMPLIRYATQDLAVASKNELCTCGRQMPLVAGIQGRVPDIVFAPDGTYLVVHFFTILFEYIPEIRQFQIVQRTKDGITARIVPAPTYDRKAVEVKVRDAISKATHGSLHVDFEYVDAIPLSPSLKRRFVISEISAPFSQRDHQDPRSGAAAAPPHEISTT